MKYKELMDTCSDIWRKYGEQGNSFLGLCEARKYCVRHIAECEDATQEQLTTIQGWQEHKDLQNEIQRKERESEILNNRKNNPERYQRYLKEKELFELK